MKWIFLFPLLFTLAFSQCHPTCSWQCDDPGCVAECTPYCSPPQCILECITSDPSQCGLMKCHNLCATDQCEIPTCPACDIECNVELICTDCQVVCEQIECSWVCEKPTDCPYPSCILECESPACECVPTVDNNFCSEGGILKMFIDVNTLIMFILVIYVIIA